jgi:hypothetical protein
MHKYSAPYPVYPREFVVLRVDKQINDSYYLFSSSISYDPCPITRGIQPLPQLFILIDEQKNMLEVKCK